ncbi:hypothetical protein [Amycolatopsis sp. NPDC051372]|uniref:hypothetical protein n=1 Tax=unclassified Amycolatopsis TaxID=2618356 RepID=UPI003442FA02
MLPAALGATRTPHRTSSTVDFFKHGFTDIRSGEVRAGSAFTPPFARWAQRRRPPARSVGRFLGGRRAGAASVFVEELPGVDIEIGNLRGAG